jgi:serine/threonine protein phosphatase 1
MPRLGIIKAPSFLRLDRLLARRRLNIRQMASKPKSPRTLVIGDIHGCFQELQDLLQTAEVSASDRIICVGDLLGKGPASVAVLDWARARPNTICIIGNHEARQLKAWRAGAEPSEKASDVETKKALGADYERLMKWISEWPLYFLGDDFLVSHAGLDPRRSLKDQRPEDFFNIRTIPGTTTPWFETYKQDQLVLFGHWAKPAPVLRANAIGLDTGCVYGGHLSAWFLEERRLVQVPARRSYKFKEGFPQRSEQA